jgi:riboflavin kinase / FMN adenylyltransferase
VSRIIRLSKEGNPGVAACVVAIGNFDGVHRGHRQILDRTLGEARKRNLPAAVVTFEPHPTKVLVPEKAIPLIVPYEERFRLLADYGVDYIAVQKFTKLVAKTPARKWVEDWLVEKLHARHVVLGYDFHFGHDAQGNAESMAQMGAELGFSMEQVRALIAHGKPISSSRIRRLVGAGEMGMVTDLLGAPFHMRGIVREGKRRGTALGFPTANLKTEWELVPARGVYACIAIVDGRRLMAGVNVGFNPTFGEEALSIEAHIVGVDRPLYGEKLALHFIARLRDEKKFDGVEELKKQMTRDMSRVHDILEKKMDMEIR